jgi:hypothetical protein
MGTHPFVIIPVEHLITKQRLDLDRDVEGDPIDREDSFWFGVMSGDRAKEPCFTGYGERLGRPYYGAHTVSALHASAGLLICDLEQLLGHFRANGNWCIECFPLTLAMRRGGPKACNTEQSGHPAVASSMIDRRHE